MVGRLKDDAGGVKSNWTKISSSAKKKFAREFAAKETYPMTLSYCCCRMLGETLQSTWPVLKVIARACAISSCIDDGMLEFLFAGPTHISVDPLCSNSLAPS